jgi:hypothetical protein
MLSAVTAMAITACAWKEDVQQIGRLTLKRFTLDALGRYHTSRSLYYNKRLVAEKILEYIPSPGNPDVILYKIDGWKDRPGGLFVFNGRTSEKLRVTDEIPMLSLTNAEHWSPDSAYVVIQDGSDRLLVVDVAAGRLARSRPAENEDGEHELRHLGLRAQLPDVDTVLPGEPHGSVRARGAPASDGRPFRGARGGRDRSVAALSNPPSTRLPPARRAGRVGWGTVSACSQIVESLCRAAPKMMRWTPPLCLHRQRLWHIEAD